MDEAEQRRRIVETCRRMEALGINQGRSGNVSCRLAGDPDGAILITPSGLDYAAMEPADIVRLERDGSHAARAGLRPSSEWRMHRDILANLPAADAVVHCHPLASVVISIMRERIPPIHYMIALAGGADIRVAPYATFGTAALSAHALAALDGRRACLLAHHGLLATGRDLGAALDLAVEVEALARQYQGCLAIGEPKLLTDAEIADALDQFANGYGRVAPDPEGASAESTLAKSRGPR